MGGKLNFFLFGFYGASKMGPIFSQNLQEYPYYFTYYNYYFNVKYVECLLVNNYNILFTHNGSIAFYKHDINVVRNKHILRTLSLIFIIVGPE